MTETPERPPMATKPSPKLLESLAELREQGIQFLPISKLKPWSGNPNRHDPGTPRLVRLMQRFGWTQPVIIRKASDDQGNHEVSAGHGRAFEAAAELGLEEVPVIFRNFTAHESHASGLADNKAPEFSLEDPVALQAVLDELLENDGRQDILDAGWTSEDLDELAASLSGDGGPTEPPPEPPTPDPPKDPVTKQGDVWLMGDHRVMCGDSTDPNAVSALMNEQTAHLLHADPPYGMGKEDEGVLNDDLQGAELDAFQMKWWKSVRPHVSDVGTAYIWGNAPGLWRLWYTGLEPYERLTMRNEVVWAKGSAGAGGISHIGNPALRQYPNETERCLVFMFGEQSISSLNADDYWSGWDDVRLPLVKMAEKAELTAANIRQVCGVGMHSHWFTKSQWVLIPEAHYDTLALAYPLAFTRRYQEIRDLYDRQRKAGRDYFNEKQDAIRAYFDNAHDNMTDVWSFPRVTGAERHGHATPKPVAMMARVMLTSVPEGGLCVEPFGGSGSTLMAAEQTGRKCYTMELSPAYCDVIVQRWEKMTGGKATLEASDA